MVTANELLAQMSGVDNRVCTIDLDTRKINIPSSITTLGVESDDGVKRLYFKMPKTYRGTDLSSGFSIRINYINANDDPAAFSPARDVKVDGDIISFYWRIDRDVVAYKGNVKFIICLKRSDADGNVEKELNTTVASLPSLEGLEADMESIQVKPIDYLAQLLAVKDEYVGDISSEGDKYLQNLDTKHEELENQLRDTATILSNGFGRQYGTRANAIVQTVEGELVAANDASDDYIRGLRVFGKSTQITTTGKNLFNSDPDLIRLLDKTTKPQYGYEVTLEPGTYIISARQKGASTTYIYASVYDGATIGENLYLVVPNDARTVTVTLTEGDTLCLFNASDYNTTIGNEDTTKTLFATHQIQIERGTVVTEYEPYTGGRASPSPDYAQHIKSVENPTISIHRKNLVRTGYSKTDTYEGMTVVITKGMSEVTLNGTTTKPYGYAISQGTYLVPGRYTMSVYGLNAVDKAYLMNMDTRLLVCDNVRTGSPVTFDVTAAGIYRIDFTFAKETSYNNSTVRFQIEAGERATEYEPIVPFETLALNRTLPGIQVIQGSAHYDQDNPKWICDEIDFERGVYVQRVLVQKFTGRETWTTNPLAESQGVTAYHTYTANGDAEFALGLCSHFVNGGAWSGGLSSKTNTFWTANTTTAVFKTDGAQSLDDFLNFLRSEYESGNPVTLYSVLRTPKETPLTEAELAAYAALHSNYPNTTVLNDSGAHMELKYNADTATFFIRSRASAELIQAAVNYYLDKSGVQVPSDEHIKDMATAAVKDTVVPNDDELDDLLAAIQ